MSTDLSVDDEDMIEHVLGATCHLSIEPVSGAGAEVAQRLDQRLDGMGQGE